MELNPVDCGCGGEAQVFFPFTNNSVYMIECKKCGICISAYETEAEAIEAWNTAMSGKDINVPNKERTAKVISYDEIITVNGYRYHYEEYLCNACKKKVFSCDSYCSSCGAKLDWSGNE